MPGSGSSKKGALRKIGERNKSTERAMNRAGIRTNPADISHKSATPPTRPQRVKAFAEFERKEKLRQAKNAAKRR